MESFVPMFIANMSFLSSEKVRRLNALTILILLLKIPVEVSTKYFEPLMKNVVYEVKQERMKVAVNSSMANRFSKRMEVFSKRKAALREKQLYQNVKLDEYFKTQMTVCLSAILAVCGEEQCAFDCVSG